MIKQLSIQFLGLTNTSGKLDTNGGAWLDAVTEDKDGEYTFTLPLSSPYTLADTQQIVTGTPADPDSDLFFWSWVVPSADTVGEQLRVTCLDGQDNNIKADVVVTVHSLL